MTAIGEFMIRSTVVSRYSAAVLFAGGTPSTRIVMVMSATLKVKASKSGSSTMTEKGRAFCGLSTTVRFSAVRALMVAVRASCNTPVAAMSSDLWTFTAEKLKDDAECLPWYSAKCLLFE